MLGRVPVGLGTSPEEGPCRTGYFWIIQQDVSPGQEQPALHSPNRRGPAIPVGPGWSLIKP